MSNQQLAEELEKPMIRILSFKDNIWDADLADKQLVSKFNKEICFLSFVIDFLSK